MDAIINELIRLDRRAKEAVENAEKQRDETKAEIQKKKNAAYEDSLKNAKKDMAAIKEKAEQETTNIMATIKQSFDKASGQLDEEYLAEKSRWIEEITAQCMEI